MAGGDEHCGRMQQLALDAGARARQVLARAGGGADGPREHCAAHPAAVHGGLSPLPARLVHGLRERPQREGPRGAGGAAAAYGAALALAHLRPDEPVRRSLHLTRVALARAFRSPAPRLRFVYAQCEPSSLSGPHRRSRLGTRSRPPQSAGQPRFPRHPLH